MAAEMPVKRFPWICTLVVTICIVTIVILWIRCPWGLRGPGPRLANAGELVVLNSETVTWTAINNKFTPQNKDECVNCWHGVLLHAGSFKDGGYRCDEIQLLKDDAIVTNSVTGDKAVYSCKAGATFPFVNIVVPDAAAPDDPIDAAAHACHLAPWGMDKACCDAFEICNAQFVSNPDACWKEYKDCRDEHDKCVEDSDQCCASNSCEFKCTCKKSRKVHHNQNVRGMLAFWHNGDGYNLKVTHDAKTWSDPPLDQYVFGSTEPFKVEVLKFNVAHGQDCLWAVEEGAVFAPGEVDEVRITFLGGGPDVVLHEDPPWPIKKGP